MDTDLDFCCVGFGQSIGLGMDAWIDSWHSSKSHMYDNKNWMMTPPKGLGRA